MKVRHVLRHLLVELRGPVQLQRLSRGRVNKRLSMQGHEIVRGLVRPVHHGWLPSVRAACAGSDAPVQDKMGVSVLRRPVRRLARTRPAVHDPAGAGRSGGTQLAVEVAVWDPLPLFRLGTLAALAQDGGLAVVAVEDPASLADTAGPLVVLLTVHGDDEWPLLQALGARQDVSVLAVLEDRGPDAWARALAGGADGVVARAAGPADLRAAVAGLLSGTSTLPLPVVRMLAGRAVDPPEPGDTTAAVPERDRSWMRALAQGQTVSELARSAGYSERMMFRNLRELYARLGAANRSQALVRAGELGWL